MRDRLILLLILIFAFFLRIHDLGAQPLRGDEAFAIRYWAAPPADVLSDLAWREPHPFGTFLGFWAWKSIAGDSEFAMRLLSALPNLLGVAALYALARRLRMGRTAALLAAALWAINPNLIWHSQDARNYAPWAGMSALALWLLVRASERNTRRDWALYVIVETLTLYVFFLEAFLLVVHGLYVAWIADTSKARTRQASSLRRGSPIANWLVSAIIIAVLLIPWGYQAYRLSGSGYGGTASLASLNGMMSFIPELWYGLGGIEGSHFEGFFVTPLLLGLMIIWWGISQQSRPATLVFMLVIIPSALLFAAATRLDVFRPRYIIAITPALTLMLAYLVSFVLDKQWSVFVGCGKLATTLVVAPILVAQVLMLNGYYNNLYPKSPDWRALNAYLHSHVTAEDALVMEGADDAGTLDPAFEYYYDGAFTVLPRTGAEMYAEIDALLATHETVYLIDNGSSGVSSVLQELGDSLGDRWIAPQFRAGYFRAPDVLPDEIDHPLALELGGGRLQGWSLFGLTQTGETIDLLLYWQTPPEPGWKTFVHLTSADGTLVTQGDHYPANGPGRDSYALSLAGVAPGTYTLRIGLYRDISGERAEIVDTANGDAITESYELGQIVVDEG